MKVSSLFTVLLAAALMFSCKEQTKEMLTVINTDGSCYREFKINEDSRFISGDSTYASRPLPVALDSSWKISWQYNSLPRCTQFPVSKATLDSVMKSANKQKTSDDGKFTVYLRKDFSSVPEMAAQFHLSPKISMSKVRVKYDFEKRFRWFYTYYHYRETYPKLNLKFNTPPTEFMTEDEANFWFTGQPDITNGMNGMEIRELLGSLESKYEEWLTYNIWETEFSYLLKYYHLLPHPPVSKSTLIAMKDSIYNTSSSKSISDYSFEKSLNKFFKTTQFSPLWKSANSPMKVLEEKTLTSQLAFLFESDFIYKLQLPGTVIQTNSQITDGKTLIWHLTSTRFVLNDYTLEAESRKANIWAFVATALLFVVAIGSFLFKTRK